MKFYEAKEADSVEFEKECEMNGRQGEEPALEAMYCRDNREVLDSESNDPIHMGARETAFTGCGNMKSVALALIWERKEVLR